MAGLHLLPVVVAVDLDVAVVAGEDEADSLEWLEAQGVNLNEELPGDPAIVLVAVKPQMMAAMARDLMPRSMPEITENVARMVMHAMST